MALLAEDRLTIYPTTGIQLWIPLAHCHPLPVKQLIQQILTNTLTY